MATHAHRGSFWRAGGGALVMAAALSGGCSFLFHVDASQCSTTSDCVARGTAFTGYTCNLGTCIAPQCTRDADCATHDAALSGFTCSQGTCVAPIAMSDGGAEAEAGGGCNTNADCLPMQQPMFPEIACNVDTHTCLQLTSPDCQYVIGDYSGTKAPPTFMGAFAVFPTTGGPMSHPSFQNYQLALTDFDGTVVGIPVGTDNDSRIPVAVACDVNANIDTAMLHLINDVHVSEIVSALPAAELSHIFQTYTSSSNSGIFVINALGADSTLTSLTTNGLLWHMLGQPSDNAPAYQAFMPLLENYIRTSAPWNLGPTTPLKVATVTASATATTELAAAVEPLLTWNGGQSTQLDATNYMAVTISYSTLNGDSPTDPLFAKSISDAAMALKTFQPNVVISFASEEFTELVQQLEIDWSSPPAPPFYLLGPYNMGDTQFQAEIRNLPNSPYKRVAGIGVASANDTASEAALLNYDSEFTATYTAQGLGEENYYDAMYFAIYARVAVGRVARPAGSDLAAGMLRLISLTAPPHSVGPGNIGPIFGALGSQGSIELIGTLGPPDFTVSTGARVGQGDVYCLDPQPDAGTYAYDYDVLTLANANGTPAVDGGSAYVGTFPCYPGIQ